MQHLWLNDDDDLPDPLQSTVVGRMKPASTRGRNAPTSPLELPGLACAEVDPEGCISAWNSGMQAIFGRTAGEMIGKPVPDFLPTEIWKSSTPVHTEAETQTKEGRNANLRIWSNPITGPDGKTRHIVIVVDDSEKKFLEVALLESAEREQRRIGQELHDHLCQHLLGAAFSAKAIAGDLDREKSASASELHDLARLINDAVTQVRDISRGLHPVELDKAGLMCALQELAVRASHSRKCTFTCEHPVFVSDPAVSINAYRIAQEAVASALHATGASKIRIALASTSSAISLTIEDDRKKEGELTADPEGTVAKTLGYRARAMHGEISLRHEPGKGTRITCKFPRKP